MYKIFNELKEYGFMAIQTTAKAGNMKEKQYLYPLLDDLGVDKKYLVKGLQTHSTNILCVDSSTNISNIENIDGYITKDANMVLMAYFADCMPIFLVDKSQKVFSLLHGGWRGSSNKILEKAINIIVEKYNSKLEDIVVVLGISISSQNYEIGYDLVCELKKKLGFDIMIVEKSNKYYLDLSKMNTQIALDSGILKENIITNDYCTFRDDFFSYRRDKTENRMVAIIKAGV